MTCARPRVVPQSQLARMFRTFDGLEIELAGRKDTAHSLIAHQRARGWQADEAQAAKINARCQGWEFEIPDYKYSAIFTPLEDLLEACDAA